MVTTDYAKLMDEILKEPSAEEIKNQLAELLEKVTGTQWTIKVTQADNSRDYIVLFKRLIVEREVILRVAPPLRRWITSPGDHPIVGWFLKCKIDAPYALPIRGLFTRTEERGSDGIYIHLPGTQVRVYKVMHASTGEGHYTADKQRYLSLLEANLKYYGAHEELKRCFQGMVKAPEEKGE
jgi:hypothetical protein